MDNGFLPINPSFLPCQNLILSSSMFQHSHTSSLNLIERKSINPSSKLLIKIPNSSISSIFLYNSVIVLFS